MESRIKMLRKVKGVKQIELAEAMAVAQSAVSNWETGRNEPDNNTLRKLAEYFDVSVDYLLGRTDKKTPDAAGAASGDMTEAEKELIRCAGLLSEDQKGFLLAVARSLLEQGQAPQPDPPGSADGTA